MSSLEIETISGRDRAEIHELIAQYSFMWDAGDADGFASLFTNDCECLFYLNGADEPAFKLYGSEAMRKAAIDRAGYFRKIGMVTKHFMPNSVITVVDQNNVRVRTHAMITWQKPLTIAPLPVQAGYYDSKVVRTADGWKYMRREVRLNGQFKVKDVFAN
jgi:hypothetical protein